jgi:CIC family chloride channel protein
MNAPHAAPAPHAARSALIRYARQGYFVALVIATGAGMGLVAVGFQEMLKAAQRLFFGPLSNEIDFSATLLEKPWVALIPALGGLIVGLYFRFVVRREAGHGVSEVILALETRQGRLAWLSSVHTAIASSITIGSGGSAGPEGPIISIGAALASGIGQALSLPPTRLRTLLAAGAAAGLAGMYHAPLTGAAFSTEVLLEDLDPRTFSLLALAAVAANAVAGQFNVSAPVTMPALPSAPWQSVPLDAALGLIAAPIGVALLLFVNGLHERTRRIALPEPLKPMLGGLVVGVIGLLLPRVLGSGEAGIDQALHDEIAAGLLFTLPLAKLAATSITLGSGATGGVFTPSLFIGATLGGAFGVTVRALWSGAGPGPAFALVGMGTVVAAAVNAPLTAILLVCEFTHDFTLLPQITIAVAAAVALARRLHPESIYTLPLAIEGIDRRLFRRSPLVRVRVCDAMNVSWPVMSPAEPLATARASGKPALPVVTPDGRLAGIIDERIMLATKRDDAMPAGEAMLPPRIIARPDESLHDLALRLGRGGTIPAVVPVIDERGHYLGAIEPGAILRTYSAADWPDERLRRHIMHLAETPRERLARFHTRSRSKET